MTGRANAVPDLLAGAVAAGGGATAIVDTTAGKALTWTDLETLASAQAGRFAAAGVRDGDRVALRLPTSADFVVNLFAVLKAGGIAVPLSPQAPAAELAPLLEHCGARVVVEREPSGLDGAATELAALSPSASGERPAAPESVRGGEDIAVISYTSGTAGPPRGVMLSHRALLANVEQLGRIEPPPLRGTDRVLVTIPLFHVYGLGPGLLHSASAGATVVLSERFDARRALQVCAEHGVTVIAGVPSMYAEFAVLPGERLGEGLATVRRLTSGAAPLHPTVLAAVRQATGLDVFEGYGLTECAPVVTSTLVTGDPKPGSVGRPLPGVELRLVDSDGTGGPVALDPDDLDDAFDEDGGTGLVSVRGDNLFSGYWPDGDHGPGEDGWFRTGDVGYLDADGDLHLVDRANDLIIVNGFNVYPREVEDVLTQLPAVAEAAVVGVADERRGETVKAIVVRARGATLSARQVVEHCATRLAGYKVPRTVEFAETLPYSATGKLRRLRLR